MSWFFIGFLGMVMVAAVGIWWRRRGPYELTSHNVRCPLHGDEARVNVRTAAQGRHPYVDVVACTLHPNEPVFVPSKIDWVPEISYYAAGLSRSMKGPIYQLGVPCRKDCLAILNQAEDHGIPRYHHHLSGVNDCLDLEREVTRHTVAETPTTQEPWSYSA